MVTTTSTGRTPPVQEDGCEEDTGTGNSTNGDATEHKWDTNDDGPGGNVPPGRISKFLFSFSICFTFQTNDLIYRDKVDKDTRAEDLVRKQVQVKGEADTSTWQGKEWPK
jgi:hypothetical protein